MIKSSVVVKKKSLLGKIPKSPIFPMMMMNIFSQPKHKSTSKFYKQNFFESKICIHIKRLDLRPTTKTTTGVKLQQVGLKPSTTNPTLIMSESITLSNHKLFFSLN